VGVTALGLLNSTKMSVLPPLIIRILPPDVGEVARGRYSERRRAGKWNGGRGAHVAPLVMANTSLLYMHQ
jgi:hypothetical protein